LAGEREKKGVRAPVCFQVAPNWREGTDEGGVDWEKMQKKKQTPRGKLFRKEVKRVAKVKGPRIVQKSEGYVGGGDGYRNGKESGEAKTNEEERQRGTRQEFKRFEPARARKLAGTQGVGKRKGLKGKWRSRNMVFRDKN